VRDLYVSHKVLNMNQERRLIKPRRIGMERIKGRMTSELCWKGCDVFPTWVPSRRAPRDRVGPCK